MAVSMKIRDFLAGGLAFFIAASSLAPAQADDEWPVRYRLLGKNGDKSEDVSGIACAQGEGFPRACLVIDDNIQAAQLITLKDGELIAGEPAPLIENSFEGKPLEFDGEGIAYADGFYFVIGSHGHPRDRKHKLKPDKDAEQIKARIAAASQIVRLHVNADGTLGQPERTGKLREIIASVPALRPFLDRRLDENGLTIEGVAVKGGRLFAGFRGPALPQGTAAILLSRSRLSSAQNPLRPSSILSRWVTVAAFATSPFTRTASLFWPALQATLTAPIPFMGGTVRARTSACLG